MFKLILFLIICGLIWAWRGYSVPKMVHGYARAFLSAFMIIGLYCLWFTEQSVFNSTPMFAVIVLTTLESILGYGNSCEDIDHFWSFGNPIGLVFEPKENYAYLGFIGMSYYLFPYIILHPYKSPIVYLTIAILGFIIFPLVKCLQIKVFNKIAEVYNLDAWKIVEGILGMGFVLWLIK